MPGISRSEQKKIKMSGKIKEFFIADLVMQERKISKHLQFVNRKIESRLLRGPEVKSVSNEHG